MTRHKAEASTRCTDENSDGTTTNSNVDFKRALGSEVESIPSSCNRGLVFLTGVDNPSRRDCTSVLGTIEVKRFFETGATTREASPTVWLTTFIGAVWTDGDVPKGVSLLVTSAESFTLAGGSAKTTYRREFFERHPYRITTVKTGSSTIVDELTRKMAEPVLPVFSN
jgi:hypothetical protein